MENTEIIQKARAKPEMWLNDAYDNLPVQKLNAG